MKRLSLILLLAWTACAGLPSLTLGGECFPSVMVEVYADVDGDGSRDAGEPPVEGVTVAIMDDADPTWLVTSAETAADGTAELNFITRQNDCGGSNLIGVVAIPAGFAAPQGSLRTLGEVWDSGQPLSIGLLPANPVQTPTP